MSRRYAIVKRGDTEAVGEWLDRLTAMIEVGWVPAGGITEQHERDAQAMWLPAPSLAVKELVGAMRELLPLAGWANATADEIRYEIEQGNGAAPIIARARAAIAAMQAGE